MNQGFVKLIKDLVLHASKKTPNTIKINYPKAIFSQVLNKHYSWKQHKSYMWVFLCCASEPPPNVM